MICVVGVLGGEFGEQLAERRRFAVLTGVPMEEFHRATRPPRRGETTWDASQPALLRGTEDVGHS
ncbi:hypothetical protein MhomT_16200 [Microbacterium hominis]|nr:hypothetical protein MhomT_16200 [Microbacterium hominis]